MSAFQFRFCNNAPCTCFGLILTVFVKHCVPAQVRTSGKAERVPKNTGLQLQKPYCIPFCGSLRISHLYMCHTLSCVSVVPREHIPVFPAISNSTKYQTVRCDFQALLMSRRHISPAFSSTPARSGTHPLAGFTAQASWRRSPEQIS